MKISITLDEELMTRLDQYADENYMSRSGLISFACTQFLNSAELTRAIRDMSFAMKKIVDTNQVDAETIKKFEDFQRLVNLLQVGR